MEDRNSEIGMNDSKRQVLGAMSGTIESTQCFEKHISIAPVFKVWAWVIWIGGLIASLFLCRDRYDNFNFLTFIVYLSAFLFSGFLVMAIAQTLDILERIEQNTRKKSINLVQHSGHFEYEHKNKPTMENKPTRDASDSCVLIDRSMPEIVCPCCGTKQRSAHTFCWYCNVRFIDKTGR